MGLTTSRRLPTVRRIRGATEPTRSLPADRSQHMADNNNRLNLPFVGLVSFMRGPVATDLSRIDGDIAILGAPTDEGTPWAPGSRFAPRKIREMSVRYAGYGPTQKQGGYYDIEEDRKSV